MRCDAAPTRYLLRCTLKCTHYTHTHTQPLESPYVRNITSLDARACARVRGHARTHKHGNIPFPISILFINQNTRVSVFCCVCVWSA